MQIRQSLIVLGAVLAWHGLETMPQRGLWAAETATPAPAGRLQSEARLRRDVTFLASDECEGRGPGTRGIDRAADHIAGQFKQAGLKPGGADGGYFQPFTIDGAVLEGPARLA